MDAIGALGLELASLSLEAKRGMAADESTRERVIRAAIDCVIEDGYYRASSNRIARRAGLTWGVIQHYFGTRDQLLIEVVRWITDRQLLVLKEAVIEGETIFERLSSYAGLIWDYFGSAEYLVSVQIVLNLSRDPAAAAETAETIADLSERIAVQWRPLLDATIGTRLARSRVGQAVGESLRGLAIGQAITAALPAALPAVPNQGAVLSRETTRVELVRAMAQLVESKAEDKQKPTPRKRGPATRPR